MAELVLGVVGATGRLGSALLAECALSGVEVGVTASRVGWVAASQASVLVDASAPEALPDTVAYCEKTGAALIYCVSRISDDARDRLRALARDVPVVLADNLSIGHWLQMRLVRSVAELTAALPQRPLMSVHERHPVTKADRPSASARSLAAAWAESVPPELCGETSAQRAGQPVSDHVVTFDVPGMSLSITHSVTDLRTAAAGLLGVAGHVRGLVAGYHPIFTVYSDVYGGSAVTRDG
ncbi:dihydrodipicolinate reductase C-terminal domain-containing protein [Kibdelosporangium persicum]|uniref:4-hydroxy-tetrahydrodipicolinate reductase n=1 Tax=Kibdelosporangium persicum TaxID=2698649 RepID=A0ABX2FIY1_9PSEU|nr:dihydrodipicolinate reductase C-terminal domain-containing protein [Kibdelosporangium persicum]NRN71359.1 Dihydrodipicolinate reductase [Kibdelosporangium persicum]